MKDQTIVITGASDGIGRAAARLLVARGNHVVLVGRSKEKTHAVAAELNTPYYIADFAELQQVRELAQKLLKDLSRIDVLVNNAGGIMGARELTVDGNEKTFQVNHVAPFLLTNILMPNLIANKAKIIQTSSIAARRFGNIALDDLQNENGYSPAKAYGNAKLANILFTRELDRRYRKKGIRAAAFHPGIVSTNFANDSKNIMRYFYHTPLLSKLFTISPEKGAETLLWLIENDTWQSGEYYEKRHISKTNPQVYDARLAEQLWIKTQAIIGTVC